MSSDWSDVVDLFLVCRLTSEPSGSLSTLILKDENANLKTVTVSFSFQPFGDHDVLDFIFNYTKIPPLSPKYSTRTYLDHCQLLPRSLQRWNWGLNKTAKTGSLSLHSIVL